MAMMNLRARAGLAAVSVVGFTLALGALFRLTGFEAEFLLAESGQYLAIAHSKFVVIKKLIGLLFTHSYGGHYAPIALTLELVQGRIFGAAEHRWFWRQMLVLGVTSTAVLFMVRALGASQGFRRSASAFGLCVAVIFAVQPMNFELAMWPFMLLQFLCLTCAAVSLYFLMRFMTTLATADFAGFVFSSYASMHTFGIGAAFSAAGLTTGAVVLALVCRAQLLGWKRARVLVGILAVGAILTTAHGLMMLRVHAQPPYVADVGAFENTVRFFALFLDSLAVGARALVGNGGFLWPRADVAPMQATYGVGVLLSMIAGLVVLARRWLRLRAREDLAVFAVSTFTLVAFCVYVVMCVFRVRTDPAVAATLPFLFGSRYVVFPSFCVLVFISTFAAYAARGFGTVLIAAGTIMAATCVAASVVFAHTVVPMIWPHLTQHQQSRWDELVNQAHRDVAAGRPIENISLRDLDPGFQADLRAMRPLLERSMGCKGCAKIEGE